MSANRMPIDDLPGLCELGCFLFDHLQLLSTQQRHVRSQRRSARLKDDEAADDAQDVMQKAVVVLQPAPVPTADDCKLFPLSD